MNVEAILASVGGVGAIAASARWVWSEWRTVRREELAAAERLAVALDRSSDAHEAVANELRGLAQRVESVERALNLPPPRRAARATPPAIPSEDSKR